ncbi:MAG TPA: transposase [Gammaproteobacteria bacterium]|nr:transposase [Gammaproteobacteria bacterium]
MAEKGGDVDFPRELVREVVHELMEAAVGQHCGAERHERSEPRQDQRNGSHIRIERPMAAVRAGLAARLAAAAPRRVRSGGPPSVARKPGRTFPRCRVRSAHVRTPTASARQQGVTLPGWR